MIKYQRFIKVYVIADEIYEHINYIGKHESIAQFPEIHNRISRGSRLDGVSACRTLWFASIYDLLMVSQEYGSHYSVVGKNLHGFWHHAFSAIRRRRFTGYSD